MSFYCFVRFLLPKGGIKNETFINALRLIIVKMAYDTKQAVIGLLGEYIAAEKEIHDKNQQAYAARKNLSASDEKLKEAGNAASASAFAVRAARNFIDYLEGKKSLEDYAARNELDELSDSVMMFFLEKRKECEFHFVAKQVYVHKLQGDFSETEKRTAIDGLYALARISDEDAISALEQAVSDPVVGGAAEKKLSVLHTSL